jgi:hypothetical protein
VDLARAPNPWTGKGVKRKKKEEKKKDYIKRVDVSTLLLLTQSTRQQQLDRQIAFLATLAPLRIQCLSNKHLSLEQAISAVNSKEIDFKQLSVQMAIKCKHALNWSLFTDACLHRDSVARLSDVHHPINIPDLHSVLMRVLVSPSIPAGATMPMAHLFRKLLPRGSAARTSQNVTKRYMQKSPLMASTINKMIVCSIVGNYPHSRNRLDMDSRAKVYEWFDPKASKNENASVFAKYVCTYKLLSKFPRFYTYLMRDHLVYLLEDDDIARKHFNAKYDYTSFKTITQSAVEYIRRYVETQPVIPGDKLRSDWTSEFGRFHNRMLRVQTKPKQLPFFQFLGETRGQAPIRLDRIHRRIDDLDVKVKIEPSEVNNDNYEDGEDEGEEDDHDRQEKEAKEEDALLDIAAETDIISIGKLMAALSVGEMGESIDSKRAKRVKPNAPKNKRGIQLTKQGLPVLASQFVYEYLRRLSGEYNSDKVFFQFLKEQMPTLGADPAGIDELTRIWQVYSDDRTPNSAIREKIYHFSNVFPFTWALVCAGWAARNFTSGIKLYKLDYSTTRNQIKALCNRFNCKQADIPPTAFKMSICMGCRTPKTWVKDPNTATNKETYSFGLKETSIDLYTRKSYCRLNKSFMHFNCGIQEIMHVDMLGYVLECRGKLYTHCPQPSGGHIAVINPAHCKANEYTLSCYSCTLEQEHVSLTKTINEHPYGPLAINKCVVCDKRVVKLVNKHVYAKNTIMCQKCHSDALLNHLLRTLPVHIVENRMTSPEAEEAVRVAILKHRSTIKENWKEHNKAKNQAILKQAKKVQWAKSRN